MEEQHRRAGFPGPHLEGVGAVVGGLRLGQRRVDVPHPGWKGGPDPRRGVLFDDKAFQGHPFLIR